METSRRGFLSLLGISAALAAVPPALAAVLEPKLEAAAAVAKRVGVLRSFAAKFKDGTPTLVYFRDCSDAVPAFDNAGNTYVAFTSYYRTDRFECYSQTDRALCDMFKQPDVFRLGEDMAHLEAGGLDVDSIVWESIRIVDAA